MGRFPRSTFRRMLPKKSTIKLLLSLSGLKRPKKSLNLLREKLKLTSILEHMFQESKKHRLNLLKRTQLLSFKRRQRKRVKRTRMTTLTLIIFKRSFIAYFRITDLLTLFSKIGLNLKSCVKDLYFGPIFYGNRPCVEL